MCLQKEIAAPADVPADVHARGVPGALDPSHIATTIVDLLMAMGASFTPQELMPSETMTQNYDRRASQAHDQAYRDQMAARFAQERATGQRRMLPTRVIADRVMNQGQNMGLNDIYPRIDQ
jgi:hypothetical protein